MASEIKTKFFLVILTLYLTSLYGNSYMMFPYLPLLLVNRKLFHRMSDYSLNLWFALCVFLLERVCKIRIFVHHSKRNIFNHSKKSSVVVMNHRTRLDWLFYFCVLYRLKALSKIKIILKDGLKKIMGPNWAMQVALFIFIKRKWDMDKIILKRFLDYYKKIEKQVMILIFPEGTNLTRETKRRSDEFAAKNNLVEYTHVLHPRTTGFNYIVNTMIENDTIDCIEDVTVAYNGGQVPESEFDFLKGRLPREIHFYVDRFQLKDVLAEPKELSAAAATSSHNNHANNNINNNHNNVDHNKNGIVDDKQNKILEAWLNKRWAEKEAFLKKFYETERAENVIEGFESQYETWDAPERLRKLIAYPIYWTLSTLLMIYLFYQYMLVKLLFVVSMLFYASTQLMGYELDELIMGYGSLASQMQTKKAI